jgi:hypothetical protein
VLTVLLLTSSSKVEMKLLSTPTESSTRESTSSPEELTENIVKIGTTKTLIKASLLPLTLLLVMLL